MDQANLVYEGLLVIDSWVGKLQVERQKKELKKSEAKSKGGGHKPTYRPKIRKPRARR